MAIKVQGSTIIDDSRNIIDAGNVGIGTDNPLQIFQVGETNSSGISTDGKIVVITEDGEVGIGTTNPSSKLEVNGNISLTDNNTYNTTFQIETPTIDRIVTIPDATGKLGIVAGVDKQIQFNNSGYLGASTAFTFNSTTNTLTVSGNLNISGIATVSTLDVNQLSPDGTDFGSALYVPVADGSGTWDWAPITSAGAGILDAIVVFDDGALIGTSGTVTALDFRGNNVTAIGTPGSFIGTITVSDTPTFDSLSVTGVSTFQGNVNLGDDDRLNIGDGNDLQIYHDGTDSIIDQVGTGDLILRTTSLGDDIIIRAQDDVIIQVAGNESAIVCNSNGSVDIRHNNIKKFETTTNGIEVTGTTDTDQLNVSGVSTFQGNVNLGDNDALQIGDSADLKLYHNGSNSYVEDNGVGSLYLRSSVGGVFITKTTGGQMIAANPNGTVELYYDASKKFETTGVGVTVFGTLETQQLNVSGVSTFQGDVYLGDNDNLYFGDSNDLRIYHSGTDSVISETGSGNLLLGSDSNVYLFKPSTFEAMLRAEANGPVELYYDGSKKFGTIGTGVSISNGASTSATIAGPSELIIDPAAVGDNTGLVRIKGDLYVDGTTTQINSTSLEIADFIVGIASTATTDSLADGAGIKIGPDNTFLYEYNSGTNPSLKSSENLNVASGKVYQIAETEVLSSTTLGSGVVNSSLTSVGTLGQLNVSGVGTFRNGNTTYGTSSASSLELGLNNNSNAGTLKLWGTTTNAYGLIQATTSNLHIDTVVGGIYLNYYDGDFISFGTGAVGESGRFTGSTGTLTLGTITPTGTASQRLQVTGGAYVSGNLGVGVTNPTNPLTVYGTQSDTIPIVALLSGNQQLGFNNGAQIAFGYNGLTQYQHFIQTRHNAGNSNNAIDFYVCDGTQNNTLTSGSVHTMSLVSGSVGINSTAPTATLDVNGTLNVSGVSTFQGDVFLGDNDSLYFGDGNDLQIFHDGSNSIIRDVGNGGLVLSGDGTVAIRNAAGTENKAVFSTNGAVELYYDNSKKFETISTGVTVTNDLYTSGNVSVAGTIFENFNGQLWNVVTQADVGYGASQVPLNQYLGQLAFLDDFSPNGLRRDGGGSDDVSVDTDGNVSIGGSIIVSGIVTATLFSGNLTGDVTGNADTATALETSRTFEITGDVVGSPISFDGTGNVSIAATIQPNSVALGGDTTGNYVATISGTAGEVEVSGSGSETAAVTIGLPSIISVGGVSASGVITATGGFSGMVVSLEQYGAAGDGVTVTTTQVQNALNSLSSGGTLYIPPGTYLIDQVTIPSNVRIVGSGVSSTYIKQNSALTLSGSLLQLQGNTNNVSIENLTVDGNNITNSNNSGLIGGQFCNNITIRNCHIINFDQQGIIFVSITKSKIKNNYFYRSSTSSTQNQALTITYSNYFGPNTGLSYDIVVDSNTFINSATIFAFHSSRIVNNYINGFGFGAGVTIDFDPYYSSTGSRHVHSLIIDNNIITGGTGTDSNGYKCGGIENWSPYSKITNNTLYGNSGTGMDQGGLYCLVTNNTIYDNGITSPGNAGISGRYVDEYHNSSYSKYTNNIVGLTTNYTGSGQQYGYQDQNFPVGIGSSITELSFIDNNFGSFTGNTVDDMFILGSNYVIDTRKNGNIGIGTDNPNRLLTLKSTNPIIGLTDYDSGGEFYIQNSSGSGILNADFFRILTNSSSEVVRISSTGNIGINSISPTAKLDVNGDVSIASTVSIGTTIDIVPYNDLGALSFEGSAGQLFSITNNLTTGSIFSVNDVSGIPSIDVDADGTVLIAPYGSTENVGIGTTNPTAKLDVNGTIAFNSTLTAGQNGKIVFPDITSIPDDPTNEQYDYITFGANGSISQVSGRGALMIASSDDALILANGDIGRTFTSSNINVDAEDIFLLSDTAVRVKSDLQNGWGTENDYVFSGGDIEATTFTSTQATGTAPFTVSSTTVVSNLNADLLDGQEGSYYTNASNISSGTLAIARGGTNSSATPTNGGVAYGTGSAYAFTAAGTSGKILTSNGAGAPTWEDAPGGFSVTNDTSTNSTYYPVFVDTTSGDPTQTSVSSTKLNFNPSTGNFSATQFTSLSDRTKKTNIRPIENALEITKQLEGVRFDWIDNDKPSVGLIAQEVEEILPELVETSDDGTKSVSYGNIIGVLIEAIKEQQKMIDKLMEK